MAYLFNDPFDTYDTAGNDVVAEMNQRWTSVSSVSGIDAAAGSISGYRILINTNSSIAKTLAASETEAVFGFMFERNTQTANAGFLDVRDAGTIHCGIGVNTAGQIFAWRGTIATVLATSTVAINLGAEVHLETKIKVDNATGLIEVRLNGNTTPILSFSGDTQNGATASFNEFRLLAPASGLTWYCDDFFCHSTAGAAPNNYIGPKHFQTKFPNGAGTYTQWAVTGAASNYQAVNTVPSGGDTNYVSEDTAGEQDSYATEDLTGTVTGIEYIVVGILSRKDSAAVEEVRTLLISDVSGTPTETFGVTNTLGSTYLYYCDVYTTNPDTAAAWTQAGVNDIQIGQEAVT